MAQKRFSLDLQAWSDRSSNDDATDVLALLAGDDATEPISDVASRVLEKAALSTNTKCTNLQVFPALRAVAFRAPKKLLLQLDDDPEVTSITLDT